MSHRNRRRKCTAPLSAQSIAGMTLVEILAVVVLLGLLAGTLAIGFAGSFGKAKQELAKTGIGQIMQKLEVFYLETGKWPENEQGLRVLTEGMATPADPYFLEPDLLTDPWGNSFQYLNPGPELRPYEILCLGADGARGGEGENADISSARLRGQSE